MQMFDNIFLCGSESVEVVNMSRSLCFVFDSKDV